MKGSTHTVQVPIRDGHTPNLQVQVDLVGKAPRVDDKGEIVTDLPPRPAYASGNLTLSIPPLHRTLAVKVAPGVSRLAPGGRTTVQVEVKGPNGAPVHSEVAVVVVDESVLTLADYKNPDPIGAFYRTLYSGASDHHSRKWIKLESASKLADARNQAPAPEPEMAEMSMNGGGMAYGSGMGALRGRRASAPKIMAGKPAPAPQYLDRYFSEKPTKK